jgi:DNA-binding XRE family transcriptional regulator
MADELTIKVCRYINENFRPRYKSNREFADSCGVDEKTMRLIQEENYNLSLLLFQRICDSQNVKMSEVLAKIGK